MAAIAGLGVLTAALAVARGARAAMPESWIGRFVAKDLPAVMAAISPRLEPQAVVFGTSSADSGFSAPAFDRRLRDFGLPIHSFNLAFGGDCPQILRLLVKKVRETCRMRRTRLRVALVEFMPESMGADYRYKRPILLALASLLSWREKAFLLPREPKTAMEVIGLSLVGSAGNLEAGTWLRRNVFPAAPVSWKDDSHDPPTEEMVSEFVRSIQEIQAVSDHVYILMTPRHPPCVRSAAMAEDRRVLSRIERETGARTIDLSCSPIFSSADFEDPRHLNSETGAPKFSKLLAEKVAEFGAL